MNRITNARFCLAIAAVAGLGLSTAGSAFASNAYWDINGSNPDATDGAATTAPGTWDQAGANANWNPLADGTGTTAGWVDGNTAVFSAGTNATGAYTVTMSGVPSIAGITTEEGSVTLGGTFSATLGVSLQSAGATINTAAGTTLTLPGFQGTGLLTKIGPGTLALTASNNTTVATMSGGMTINEGTVLLSKNQGTGSTTSPITLNGGTLKQNNGGTSISIGASKVFTIGANGGTFDAVGSGSWIVDSQLTGSGTITKNGNNILGLVGYDSASPFSGKFIVNLGELNPASNGIAGDDTRLGTANASDVITLNGGVNSTIRIATLSNTISSGHGITLGPNGGGLNIVGAAITCNFNSVISGSGPLFKTSTSTGTAILNAANTFSGDTRVLAGTLTLGNSLALQNSTLNMDPSDAGAVTFGTASATLGGLSGSRNLAMPAALLAIGNNNANTTYSGVLSGTGSGLQKVGTGTTTLTGANTYDSGTNVTGGTLVAGHSQAFANGALTVANGATAQVQSGLANAVVVTTLNTQVSGQMDITNGAMVIRGSTPAAVTAQIVSGFNGGAWNGPGINSSTAAADSNGLTAIGYASNADYGASDFKGVTGLTANDMLVRYTYYGDADLDGQVTLDDFSQFLNGYQTQSAATNNWLNGDFDYDGAVTLDDFSQFLFGYQHQGAPLGALESMIESSSLSSSDKTLMLAAVEAVPEPTSLALLSLAGAGLLVRRRRR